MKLTARLIAERVGGSVDGDPDQVIDGMAGLREARPGDLSFLANPRYARVMGATQASAVIVSRDWRGTFGGTLIRVGNPDEAFAAAAAFFAPPPVVYPPGVHPTAVLAANVKLGTACSIGPWCVLEDGVTVGDRTVLVAGCYLGHGTRVGGDCLLHAHVTTREGTRIGDRVIIHNGAVIGSDGFGYVRQGEVWEKIRQAGIVEIGDDVEIGANTTVDRARFGKTVIASGVKIDNLVQVAHNVRIGEHSALAAQVGISGSTTLGRGVQVGGQAGFAGHISVGDRAVVSAKAGVMRSVPAGVYVAGAPAQEFSRWRKTQAQILHLEELRKQVRALAGGRAAAGEDAPESGADEGEGLT